MSAFHAAGGPGAGAPGSGRRALADVLPSTLLALLAALLLVLSLPPFDLSLVAWVALVPLLLALERRRLAAALGLSWLTGFVFFRATFYWVNGDQGVTWTDGALLGLYLGSYVALFGVTLAFVRRRTSLPLVLTAPAVWVATEYLRSHAGFLALPWALVGHSQYRNLPLVQVASVAGAYGLSFLIVLVNAGLAELVVEWPRLHAAGRFRPALGPSIRLLVPVVLLGACAVYGYRALAGEPPRRTVTVTVVQGNIPQAERWGPAFAARNLDRHVGLTRQARAAASSLIVWPETSVPGVLTEDPALSVILSGLARETGTHLLVGSAARPKLGPAEAARGRYFNSAVLLSPRGGLVGQYNKMHLLPFGEYLPYKDVLPWPARLVRQTPEFVAGTEYTVLSLDGVPFGVAICWENIFPGIVRGLVRGGARFVVNLTNEAWFGPSAAPYQFLAMAVFRAVENRVAVVRAANTGISAFVDPYGRILRTVREGDREVFVAGVATESIPIATTRTWYTEHGDLFASAMVAVAVLCLALAIRGRARPGAGRGVAPAARVER